MVWGNAEGQDAPLYKDFLDQADSSRLSRASAEPVRQWCGAAPMGRTCGGQIHGLRESSTVRKPHGARVLPRKVPIPRCRALQTPSARSLVCATTLHWLSFWVAMHT